MSIDRLWTTTDCASRRGPREACYEQCVCACARSAVYSRFAFLLMAVLKVKYMKLREEQLQLRYGGVESND